MPLKWGGSGWGSLTRFGQDFGRPCSHLRPELSLLLTNHKLWRGFGEKETYTLLVRMWKQYGFSKNLKIDLLYDPAIPFLGVCILVKIKT